MRNKEQVMNLQTRISRQKFCSTTLAFQYDASVSIYIMDFILFDSLAFSSLHLSLCVCVWICVRVCGVHACMCVWTAPIYVISDSRNFYSDSDWTSRRHTAYTHTAHRTRHTVTERAHILYSGISTSSSSSDCLSGAHVPIAVRQCVRTICMYKN